MNEIKEHKNEVRTRNNESEKERKKERCAKFIPFESI